MNQAASVFVDREHEEARRAFPHEPDLARLEGIWGIGWHLEESGLRDSVTGSDLATWDIVVSTHNPDPRDPEGEQADIEAWNGKWVACWTIWLDGECHLINEGPSADLYLAVTKLRQTVEQFKAGGVSDGPARVGTS